MNDDPYSLRGKWNRVVRAGAAFALALSLAACQSSGKSGAPVISSASPKAEQPAKSGKVDIAALEQFCPRITLRSGTAYYDRYEKGGDGDPGRIVNQASITEVSRSCTPDNDNVKINAALAGRIVPGPKGKPGTVTVPVRVAVVKGDQVIYSKLFKHDVKTGQNATDFIFNDPDIVIPKPDRPDIGIFIGFDPGPYKTP
jgi:hypothetical protein